MPMAGGNSLVMCHWRLSEPDNCPNHVQGHKSYFIHSSQGRYSLVLGHLSVYFVMLVISNLSAAVIVVC